MLADDEPLELIDFIMKKLEFNDVTANKFLLFDANLPTFFANTSENISREILHDFLHDLLKSLN